LATFRPVPFAPAATTVRTIDRLTGPVYDVVLLATDGSTPASRALDPAVTLAAETGATLHVLSVVDAADLGLFSGADVAGVDDVLRSAAEATVADVVERVEAAGVDVVPAIRVGSPHREICAYADEVGADIVVVGTHGRSGLSRALLGSVAARVIRFAPVPVLVVPPI
jgi:nucleotide-binding universal stress UspA family protein